MSFLDWITGKSSRKTRAAKSLRKTGAHRMPGKPARRAADSIHPEVGDNVDAEPPGLIRNRFIREDTGTHETLKIVDDSILEDDTETGADPYNTGRFDRSKSWDSFRSRK